MPRYHFNVHDGVDQIDVAGTDLPDCRAAQIEATKYAGELLRHAATSVRVGEDWYIEVTDEDGLILFRLDFHIARVAEKPKNASERT